MAGELRLGLGTAPALAAGYAVVYGDTADKKVKVIDANGVVSVLNNDGMKNRNILDNGGFSIQQRVATAATAIPGASTTTRAGCVADRWAVTTGNTTTCLWTQVDTGAANEANLLNKHYGKITQNTNAAKFILSQFIQNDGMHTLRGQVVRLSVKIKQFVGSNANYRLGLLQLQAAGTIDVCPTFISAIGAASVEPTWGTALAAINPNSTGLENCTASGAALTIASTAGWVRSSGTFLVPTDCKNLCPVLYRDTLGAASDAVGVAEFIMSQGTDIVDWVPRGDELERMACKRFFCKSFAPTTVPAQNAGVVGTINGLAGKAGATALGGKIHVQFPVTMFAAPTVTIFCPTEVSAQIDRIDGATPIAHTATAQLHLSQDSVYVTSTGTANTAVGDHIALHYTADCEFKT